MTAILLTALNPSPLNPRKTFAGIEELALSMHTHGQLAPLIVRRIYPEGYEVLGGHRRLAAAKSRPDLFETLECTVRELDDAKAFEVMLADNFQRDDLSELEEAEAFHAMEEHGYSVPQICERLQLKPGVVYARLKLINLTPEGRQALATKSLPPSVAVVLARAPGALQGGALRDLKKKWPDEMPVREAVEFLHTQVCRALREAPFDVKDDMLVPDAPPCAKCPKNSANALPGLFDDLAGQSTCTDLGCWDAKRSATWLAITSAAVRRGLQVLPESETAKLFVNGNLPFGSKYVELATPNHKDPKKRSWLEMWERVEEAKRPKLFLARDKDWKPRELVVLAELEAALKASSRPPRWLVPAESDKKAAATEREERQKEKAEAEFAERVLLESVMRCGARIGDFSFEFLLMALASRNCPRLVLDAAHVETREEFVALVGKADERSRRALLLAYGLAALDLDPDEEPPTELKAMLRNAGVRRADVEKDVRAAIAAEKAIAEKK